MKRDDLHLLISEDLGYKCPTKQCSQCIFDHKRPLEYNDYDWPNWSKSEVANVKLLDAMISGAKFGNSISRDNIRKFLLSLASVTNRKDAVLLAYAKWKHIKIGPEGLED